MQIVIDPHLHEKIELNVKPSARKTETFNWVL